MSRKNFAQAVLAHVQSGNAFLILALLVLCATALPIAGQSQRRTSRPRTQRRTPVTRAPRIDYTNFSHQTHTVNQKLGCDSCHKMPSKNWKEVRTADAAFADVTDFPEHASCLSCHRTQFFARERPAPKICSNCHIAVTPRDNTRWLFPSLGDLTDAKLKRRDAPSEFLVGFPHDRHLDVVGYVPSSPRTTSSGFFVKSAYQDSKKPAPPASCPVCHVTYQPQGNSSEEYVTKPPKTLGDNFWLKKGTFKTEPNSHTVCFTCHNADSGVPPDPKDCHSCHKLRPSAEPAKVDFDAQLATGMGITDRTILRGWSNRHSAGAFRHEGGEHPDINCLSCHNVATTTFNTTEPKTTKVPVSSCGGGEGCHITATADDGGILNFEIDQKKKDPGFNCTKCHVVFGKEAIPAGHLQALPAPKAKSS